MRAAIALGSNLPSHFGDPSANLREALHRLTDLGTVTAASSFFDTAPIGYTDQPRFLNAAAILDTDLGPLELLRGLLRLEQTMGRRRTADMPPKGPRVIDLDLLLYEDSAGHSLILNDPDLVLPHPEMHRRAFVLEPLAEIAPTIRHPLQNRSASELLTALNAAAPGPLAARCP